MIPTENEIPPLPITSPVDPEKRYDLSILQEMDDEEYIIEIVTLFLNDTPMELSDIKEALVTGDTGTVFKKAHKLKSGAGILQAGDLVYGLAELEQVAKLGTNEEKLTGLFENVQHHYKDLEYALQKLLKTMKA